MRTPLKIAKSAEDLAPFARGRDRTYHPDVRRLLILLAACEYNPQAAVPTDAPSDGQDDDGPPPSPIAADPPTNATSAGVTAELIFDHAVGEGDDRYLLVGISTSFGNTLVESVSYGDFPLVRLGQRKAPAQEGRVEIWALDEPAPGTAAISIQLDDSASTIVAGVGSYRNVARLGPFASGSGNLGDPTLSIENGGAGALAFGIVTWRGGDTGTLSDGMEQQATWNERSGAIVGAGATSTELAPTFQWIATGVDDSWAVGAVVVFPE